MPVAHATLAAELCSMSDTGDQSASLLSAGQLSSQGRHHLLLQFVHPHLPRAPAVETRLKLAGSSGQPSGVLLLSCGSAAASAATSGAAAVCTAPAGGVRPRPQPEVTPLDSLSGGHRDQRCLNLTGVVLPSGRCRQTQWPLSGTTAAQATPVLSSVYGTLII